MASCNFANLLEQFYNDLLNTEITTTDILSKYDADQKDHLRAFISNYFNQVMDKSDVNYLKFNSETRNFGLLGSRFKTFVSESLFFESNTIEKYSNYFGKYGSNELNLDEIEKVILNIVSNEKVKINSSIKPIDYKIAAYEQIDAKKIHLEISSISNVNQQLNHLLEYVQLSSKGAQNLYDIRDYFESILRENTELNKFSPKLLPFGGLVNGLGMYDSDIDMVIKFETLATGFAESASLRLKILKVIDIVLKQAIPDLKTIDDLIIPSKTNPIVKLDFERIPGFAEKLNATNLCFNTVDFNVNGFDGLHNSAWLKYLTEHDHRFREVTLVLKYFVKQNKLIHRKAFSSYAFTLKIIFFLNNTSPPILPTFDHLQSLAPEPIWVKGQNVAFCSDHSKIEKNESNKSTTQELIVEFFNFYNNFDYDHYGMNVQSGRKETKDLNADKLEEMSLCCEAFSGPGNITKQISFENLVRWKRMVKDIAGWIDPNNCVQLLSDPSNWQFWSVDS